MKRRSKLISCFLVLFLILEITFPVKSMETVFADSLSSDSVNKLDNGQVSSGDNFEEEILGDSLEEPVEEIEKEDTQEKNGESLEESGKEVEILEDGTDTLEDSNLEENEKVDENNYIQEDGNGSINPMESETKVLEGGIDDNPITTWAFSGIEDLNKDGIIDVKDLSLAATKYNARKGQSNYNATNDFNGDGIIDVYDLVRVSSKIGTKGKIVVDPGHGGSDPGAIGPTGLKEKDVVLKVGLKVRDLLKNYGYTVVMTKTTDKYVSLQERCDIANNSDADFFISIHNNSFSDSSANGTETYSFFPNDLGGQLAKSIQTKLVSTLGRYNRGHKTADFYVLRNTKMPAALAELAFISNPKEESLLRTDEFQTKAAKAIVDGILGFN